MNFANTLNNSIGIYIHWPFCLSKCPYCDFNSHVNQSIDTAQWQKAYIAQIDQFELHIKGKNIISIFFGGGTPSLAPPQLIAAIIEHLHKNYNVDKTVEITLEANPTSVELNKFTAFKAAGVNRISVGIQSLDDKNLKFLGRTHSRDNALHAIKTAAQVFENYTFDLMYALPAQSIAQWRNELETALQFCHKHLSLYQLTIEKGTPFYKDHKHGKFTIPEADLAAEFYDITQEIMHNNNLPAYEISNHAVHGFESIHNLNYWLYGEYIGIGPGAHGRLHTNDKIIATVMEHNPNKWLEAVFQASRSIQQSIIISPQTIRTEKIMLGLRTHYGIDSTLIDQNKAKHLLELDLLYSQHNRLIATAKGRLVLNSLIEQLI